MKPAIRINGLGKKYRITQGTPQGSYRTLRESLVEMAAASFRRLRRSRTESDQMEDFWALRDVTFEVQPGAVVGIIGRNGAGKSTLLKILSRITTPTTGRVEIGGRVGSLLEVGTGFHPELTGRENVYLNGSILGMSKREIDRRFDEIIAFAEIDKFLDTPVKRYSSGMYVRLAFAVAAHLDPEILIVDEVLAVGDAAFQRKCLLAMKEVSHAGRTVLLVSHNMAAITALCDRCIVVTNGTVTIDSGPENAIRQYLQQSPASDLLEVVFDTHVARKGARMTRAYLSSQSEHSCRTIQSNDPLVINVQFRTEGESIRPVLGIVIKDIYGGALFGNNNRIVPGYDFDLADNGMLSCKFDRLPLLPGTYLIDLYLGDSHQDLHVVTEALSFDVGESDVFGSGKLPPRISGPFICPATWSLRRGS